MAKQKSLVLAMEKLKEDEEDFIDYDYDVAIEEINALLEKSDKVISNIHSLEKNRHALENYAINSVSIKIINNIIRKISTDLDIEEKFIIPCVESFNTDSDIVENTNVALETIGSFLSTMWEKFKQFITELWNRLSDFIFNVNRKINKIEKTLDSRKKEILDAINNKTAPNELLENEKLWMLFCSVLKSNEPITFKTIEEFNDNILTQAANNLVAGEEYKKRYDIIEKSYQKAMGLFYRGKLTFGDFENLIKTLSSDYNNFIAIFTYSIAVKYYLINGKVLNINTVKVMDLYNEFVKNSDVEAIKSALKSNEEQLKNMIVEKKAEVIEKNIKGNKVKCLDKKEITDLFEFIKLVIQDMKKYQSFNVKKKLFQGLTILLIL